MSESIDRRVVEMRFDNKDFEQNVNTTMTVLEKLKEKLNFKNAGKNFDSASGLSGAIEGVKNRFSALEVVGMTALVNLTNSAINLGKHLARSLTVDQVRAGFSEYELKMGSIQTIMASTGESIDSVNKYLNDLNTYSDKTIYSFSDMTSSIGKFTNAGVDLDTAVKAIQGISNEAAVSGANAQEASRAMYNFAQALSAGYVKLIDWKSIENANMATKEFKQQLIDTAVAEGTLEKAADGTYKVLTSGAAGGFKESITATKNFNDSLSAAWMTTDVLTKTLGRYADETTDIGKKAFAAAQDVKTFTQLLDTVKEAIGSGWAQTFEIIFGNLEEAKQLWTGVNKVISGFVDGTSDARNKLLQGWKDYSFSMQEVDHWQKELRESLIEYGDTARDVFLKSLGNIFKGFANLIRPIKDAFQSVFSPITSTQLVHLTTNFAKFSVEFRRTMATLGRRLKMPFVDIFKAGKDVIDLFKDALHGLFDVVSGGDGESALFAAITTFAKFIALLARGVSAVIAFVRATGIFSVVYNLLRGINDVLFRVLDSLSLAGAGLSNVFSELAEPLGKVKESFVGLFDGFDTKKIQVINSISAVLGKLFGMIGTGLSKLNLAKVGGLLAGGGIMAAALKISKLIGTISEKLDGLFGGKGGDEGKVGGIKGILESLGDALNQFQASLKVGQLVSIAISIGILAASCVALSNIPAKKLGLAVAAIGGLFTELGIASHLMHGANTKGIIAMSIAVAILAKAVKSLSEVESMGKGLLGVGAILGEIAAFCLLFDKLKIKPRSLKKTGEGLIFMAVAINLLVKPVKELGSMDTGQLIQGLEAVGAMLAGFTLAALAFSKVKTKGLIKAGLSMAIMAEAMRMLVNPLSQLGSMNLDTLSQGLKGMGIALAELAGFTLIMSKIAASSGNIMKASAALLIMSIGIKIIAGAIEQMGADANAGQGLSVLFGSLLILAGAMAVMQNTLAGAAAMIIVAGALMIMAPAIAVLSSLNIIGVMTGLAALAGTLIVFGAASAILGPIIPLMIGLAAAMALLGVGVLSLGAGITLLVGAFAMATGPIIDGAKAISEAFPIIAKGVGQGIIEIIKIIGDSAQEVKNTFIKIIEAIISVIYEAGPRIIQVGVQLILWLLEGLSRNIQRITELAISIIVNFVNGISAGLPDIVDAGVNLMISFMNSMADTISTNGDRLANAFANVLLAALSAIVGLIPGFGKKGKEMIDEYRKGFEDRTSKGNLDKTAKNIGKDIEKNVKPADQTSTGKNVVNGITTGMENRLPSLRSVAKKVADIVDDTIKKRNQIESPSKRLMRTGSYMMEGLILGVDRMTGQYEKKAENISTIMISSANKTADEMSALMNRSLTSGFDFSNSIERAVNVDVSLQGIVDRNTELSEMMERLSGSLDGVVDTMNSRSLNNYITISGNEDPDAFADALTRRFKLNARTM